MTSIPTWRERAMTHPDHQTGMVSEGMLEARMQEEIDDLRAEIERLHKDLLALCDNAIAAGESTLSVIGDKR